MSTEEAAPVTPEAPEVTEVPPTGEEAATPEASATPESGDTPADKPKKGGVQKRIGELVREREDAKREAEYWRKQALEDKGKPEPKPQTEEKPKVDQFQSYEEYLEALADWKAEQKFTEREKKREQETRQERASREFNELRSTFAQRAEQAAEKYEDFEEVAFSPDVPVSEAMVPAILSSEHGPDLMYYLGQNPKEAARIARLSPIAAARELGKLEAKLSEPPAKRPSKAPEPINPVGGRADAGKDPSKMTDAEWMKWRESELSKR